MKGSNISCLIFVGKQRRLQFVECPNEINAMIDCAKFADLALLLIDGSYGFEMVISFSFFVSWMNCVRGKYSLFFGMQFVGICSNIVGYPMLNLFLDC